MTFKMALNAWSGGKEGLKGAERWRRGATVAYGRAAGWLSPLLDREDDNTREHLARAHCLAVLGRG